MNLHFYLFVFLLKALLYSNQKYSEELIPDAVWCEVAYHRPSVFKHRDINYEKVNVVLDEDILSVCRLFCLGNGELEAIPSPCIKVRNILKKFNHSTYRFYSRLPTPKQWPYLSNNFSNGTFSSFQQFPVIFI